MREKVSTIARCVRCLFVRNPMRRRCKECLTVLMIMSDAVRFPHKGGYLFASKGATKSCPKERGPPQRS